MERPLTGRVSTYGPKVYATTFEANERLETKFSQLVSPFAEGKTKPLVLPRGTKPIVAKEIPIKACQDRTMGDYLHGMHVDFFKMLGKGTPMGLITRAARTDAADLPLNHPSLLEQKQSAGHRYIRTDSPGEITMIAAHPYLPIMAIATSNSRVYIHDERDKHRRFAAYHLEPAKVFGRTPQITALCFSRRNQLAVGLDNEVGQVDLWTLDMKEMVNNWTMELVDTDDDTESLIYATCDSILLPPGITNLKRNYMNVPVSGPVRDISFSQTLAIMAVSTTEYGSGVFILNLLAIGNAPTRILKHINGLGNLKPDYCTAMAWSPSGSPSGFSTPRKSKFTKSQYQQLRKTGNTLFVGTRVGSIHVFKVHESGTFLNYSKVGVFNVTTDIWKFTKDFGERGHMVRGGITKLLVLPKQLEYGQDEEAVLDNYSTTCLVTFADYRGIFSLRFTLGEGDRGHLNENIEPWIFFLVLICNVVLGFIFAVQWICDLFNSIPSTSLIWREPGLMVMEVEGLIETPYVTEKECPDIDQSSGVRMLPKKSGVQAYSGAESAIEFRQWEFITKPGLDKDGKSFGADDQGSRNSTPGNPWYLTPRLRSQLGYTPGGEQFQTNNPFKDAALKAKEAERKNEQYRAQFSFGGYIESMAVDRTGRRLLVSFIKYPSSMAEPDYKLTESCNVFLFKLENVKLELEEEEEEKPSESAPEGELVPIKLQYEDPFTNLRSRNEPILATPYKRVKDLRLMFMTPRKTPLVKKVRFSPPLPGKQHVTTTLDLLTSIRSKPTIPNNKSKNVKVVTALVPIGAVTPDFSLFSDCGKKSAAHELLSPSPWTSDPAPPFSASFRDPQLHHNWGFARTSKVCFINRGGDDLPWDSQMGCYVICWHSESMLKKDGKFRGDCVVRLPVGGNAPSNPFSKVAFMVGGV